jgi:hypothetical protein
MPQLMEPSATPTRGEGCAIRYTLTGIRAVGLSPVTDLGNGRVMQDIFDGNACHWQAYLLVQDCTTGQALVIGPDRMELSDTMPETGIDRIVALLQAGQLTDLAAIPTGDYPASITLAAGARISINGQPLDTSCACTTFYPGAGQ